MPKAMATDSLADIPLDPNLFNPDVVGSPHPDHTCEESYPAEDGWQLEDGGPYYDTDDDSQELECSRSPILIQEQSPDRHLHESSAESDSDSGDGGSLDDSEGEDASEQEQDSSDLRRLIGAIRARENRTAEEAGGILRKEWDRSMDQELTELQEAESSVRQGKRRKKYKLRGEPELSIEVSILLGKANLCFVEKNYQEAIPLFEEAVRIEPMCKMAWNNLGAIYQDLGDFEKSCQFRMIGAHLTAKSAETWKELGAESRQHGLLSQAIYCYSQAIKAGKDEIEAMWDRSYLLYELGKPRPALAGYLALLKLTPHNPDVLREVAHLYAITGEVDQPIKLFQDALTYYQQAVPAPTPQWIQEGFGLEHIRTLVNLLMKSQQKPYFILRNSTHSSFEDEEQLRNRYHCILKVIKQSIRWLQGRGNRHADDYMDWDQFEDDREYDTARRAREGWELLPSTQYESSPVFPLEPDFRVNLGICRLKLGEGDEAALHFESVRNLGIEEHTGLFMSIGDAYHDCGRWEEALEFYHDLTENDSTNIPVVWCKIGQCYRSMGDLEGAVECFEAVNETDPLDLVSKTHLAEIYELLGDRQKAFAIVNDIIETRRKAREDGTVIEKDPCQLQGLHSPPDHSAARPILSKSLAECRLEELQTQQYVAIHRQLEGISSKLASPQFGQDLGLMTEYVWVANPIVEGFRKTPALFPAALTSKYTSTTPAINPIAKCTDSGGATSSADGVALGSSPCQHFQGIEFKDWVQIFVNYAFCCCRIGRSDEACEVLNHVVRAPVFRQSAPIQQVLRLAQAATFFHMNDFVAVTETIRWLGRRLIYHSDPVRLLSALLYRGFPQALAFFNGNTQKWLLRQIKFMDEESGKLCFLDNGNGNECTEVPNLQQEEDSTHSQAAKSKQSPLSTDEPNHIEDVDEDEDDYYWKPCKFNPSEGYPVFMITLGQILAGTRSYKSAIVYYLRLYESYPDDPLLNLLLAIAYVHRAMQRQTDNRHHQVVQALAFWGHYRDVRLDKYAQEVEYNLARMFHGLGLTTLAVFHYNQVLSMAKDSDKVSSEHNDLSTIAAYNLVMIYSTSGSMDLAHQLMHQYLSV